MKNSIRNHYFIAFFVTLTISAGLIIGGFFTPPTGEIDGSLLSAVGELFLWPALAFGAKALDDNRKIKIQTGHTSITVGDQNVDEIENDEVS